MLSCLSLISEHSITFARVFINIQRVSARFFFMLVFPYLWASFSYINLAIRDVCLFLISVFNCDIKFEEFLFFSLLFYYLSVGIKQSGPAWYAKHRFVLSLTLWLVFSFFLCVIVLIWLFSSANTHRINNEFVLNGFH